MTFTGGEPTVEAGFAADLAEALKAEGVPVAMETCGLFPSISSSVGRVAAACRG